MKSLMILCTALLFLCLSTVFSLLFYEQDSSAADMLASNIKEMTTLERHQEKLPYDTVSASSFPEDAPSSENYSNITQTLLERLTEFSGTIHLSRRAIEPVSIFLFGAGLIGLAIFTRRKFSK